MPRSVALVAPITSAGKCSMQLSFCSLRTQSRLCYLADYELLTWPEQARKSGTFLFVPSPLNFCLCSMWYVYRESGLKRLTKHSLIAANWAWRLTVQQASPPQLLVLSLHLLPQLFMIIQQQVWLMASRQSPFSCGLFTFDPSRLCDCFHRVLSFVLPRT